MAKHVEDAFEEHLQRLHQPDGTCLHCGCPANQHHPVGPITVTVSEPDDCDDVWTYEFCNWRCIAAWFAREAGGDYVEARQ